MTLKRPLNNQGIMKSTRLSFPFSVHMCASISEFALLWLIGPLPLSFFLPCPSYSSPGHSGTNDPVCGKRWERSGSTKGLAAINFAQATFTIIQRDSRLIALTLSPRQARLSQRSPFPVNTKELSRFAFIRAAERKCWRGSLNSWVLILLHTFLCIAHFYFPLRCYLGPCTEKSNGISR